MNTSLNRRQFLAQTVTAVGLSGIGDLPVHAADRTESLRREGSALIDTHAYLGHWPHASLPGQDPRELIEILHKNNVIQAWVGSFDGLFHKDIAGVNARLAEACSTYGNGTLLPFGTVNLTLPDWQDDLRRCGEIHHMPGIRLHPTYHGYTLADVRFAQLLGLAAKAKLIVQLVTWLDEAKHRWLAPPAEQAEIRPTSFVGAQAESLSPATGPPILVLGAEVADISNWMTALSPLDVSFDVSRYTRPKRESFIGALRKSNRIVFGSRVPLRPIEQVCSLLVDSDLANDRRQAIERRVAEQIIGRP